MSHSKSEHLLRLLMLLAGNKKYTIAELETLFEVSGRTLYRYLNQITGRGFVVQQENGRYYMAQHNAAAQGLNKLLHFSPEEVRILYKTLHQIEGTSAIAERLVKKLHALYDVTALANAGAESNLLENITQLTWAIANQKQVLLHHYRSGHSGQIATRCVEPFEMGAEYKVVWCYDTYSNSCKQFKISRMGEVEALATSWANAACHQVAFIDAFRMAAEAPIATVEALLTLKAYNLLVEEYPLAEPYVQPIRPGCYRLLVPVASYEGIGRLALGLLGEFEAKAPAAFLDFLKQKIKNFSY